MKGQIKRFLGYSLEGSGAEKLLSPWNMESATLLGPGCVLLHPPRSSMKLVVWRFFMEASLHRPN